MSGALRGFAKVTRDLTERRRMEEEKRSAAAQVDSERARAEEARLELRARDEFISVAAHELRTPLTALAIKLRAPRSCCTRPGRTAPVRPEGSPGASMARWSRSVA